MSRNIQFESKSARTLIAHAERRIAEFEQLQREYSGTHPYRLFRERDASTGLHLFKAQVERSPPIELSPVAFDVLHALRSSLDHVVYDAAKRLGGKPSPKFTKFPFGKTKKNASDDLGRKKSEVPIELQKFLLSFKPYRRGNRAIWGLNDLRNEKIHRTLGTMAIANTRVLFGDGIIGRLHFDTASKWDGRKNQLTYLEARSADNINVDINITINVTFVTVRSPRPCGERLDADFGWMEADSVRLI